MKNSVNAVEKMLIQEAGNGFEVIDLEASEAVYGGGNMSGSHTYGKLTDLISPIELDLAEIGSPFVKNPL